MLNHGILFIEVDVEALGSPKRNASAHCISSYSTGDLCDHSWLGVVTCRTEQNPSSLRTTACPSHAMLCRHNLTQTNGELSGPQNPGRSRSDSLGTCVCLNVSGAGAERGRGKAGTLHSGQLMGKEV